MSVELSDVSPFTGPAPLRSLCMVLCEKGCFNRYGQDPGSKVANYVRTEKLLYCDGPLTPLSLGQSATQGTQYFYVFVFTGRYVEVFTACDGVTADGSEPGR